MAEHRDHPARPERAGDIRRLAPLFRQLADPAVPEQRRRHVRDTLVTSHLALADRIAKRFGDRGQPADDVAQVARVGLILAVDRFDPDRGHTFPAFAVPTITGEVRRFFRDATWSVSLPRRLQESRRAIAIAADGLRQELGTSPRPRQIADRLGIPVEEVYEGLRAGLAYRPASLDSPDQGALGDVDERLELVENLVTLHSAIADLPGRDAEIVCLRFFRDLTQAQIAQRVGLSQMQVSRILSASLERLRAAFFDRPVPAGRRGRDAGLRAAADGDDREHQARPDHRAQAEPDEDGHGQVHPQ